MNVTCQQKCQQQAHCMQKTAINYMFKGCFRLSGRYGLDIARVGGWFLCSGEGYSKCIIRKSWLRLWDWGGFSADVMDLLPLGAFAAMWRVSVRALLVLADSRLCLSATVAAIIVAVVFLVERYRSRHCVFFSSDTVFSSQALLVRRFKTFYQHITYEYYTQRFVRYNLTGKTDLCFNITVNFHISLNIFGAFPDY